MTKANPPSLRACAECGEQFWRTRNQIYCTPACRTEHFRKVSAERHRETYVPKRGRDRTFACDFCGAAQTTSSYRQRFCDDSCCLEWYKAESKRKVREAWRNRPPCVECGGRIPDGVNMNATACSPLCRSRRDAKKRTSPKHGSPEQRREYNRRYRERNPDKFVWNDTKKAAYHRRRARKKTGSAGERIVPRQVFERDGWRCGCCGKRVNPDLAWPHPKSASLDHIVPLSKGGTHTLANVQCAHLDCNTKKRDNIGGAGDQLRLIG